MANRLASSTSPYLRQHADNPVDWREWGDEAFAEARKRDVPVLVSIGYAACHWCHVMAHESFEDEATADYLNEHFVAVKVDREERPDVDAVYMDATQAMTGHGGWPMTVFTTPDGEPFYTGTYFPPTGRHGLPGFLDVCSAIAKAWHDQRDEVVAVGGRVIGALAERSVPSGDGATLSTADLDAAVPVLAGSYDAARGGFGEAPKFPASMVLEALLRHHARTGDATSLAMVASTCAAMARGGLYDQLGGGFARYSVDAAWVVPHFEKMLYDNALLLRVYLHWWRAAGDPLARRVVEETAEFLLRELRTPEGGFASSLDADTEGHEGRFYSWTPDQLSEVLGEDAVDAARWFSVTDQGTFEHGSSVLQRLTEPAEPGRYERVRDQLFSGREKRVRPGRDDKVVAAWNGLAVAALAEAGALLGRVDWLDAAREAAALVLDLHVVDGRLRRVSRDGVVGRPAGVLEDHADLAEGLLALHMVTGEERWFAGAGLLLELVLDHFSGWYDTADDATDPRLAAARPDDPTDNATPSGRAAAAGALLTYAALTGCERHRSAAERALSAYPTLARQAPRFAGWALAVGEALADGPREVAVVGPPDDPAYEALRRTALMSTAPGAVLAAGAPGAHPAPLHQGRGLAGGAPTAYVCRGFVCALPTGDPAVLARQLQEAG
jgi:uncharacterized protein YyaL (SSP411 family)